MSNIFSIMNNKRGARLILPQELIKKQKIEIKEYSSFDKILFLLSSNLVKINSTLKSRYVEITSFKIISHSLGIFKINQNIYRSLACHFKFKGKTNKDIYTLFLDLIENNKVEKVWWKDWMVVVNYLLVFPKHLVINEKVHTQKAQDIIGWCIVNRESDILRESGFLGVYPLDGGDNSIIINLIFSKGENLMLKKLEMLKVWSVIMSDIITTMMFDLVVLGNSSSPDFISSQNNDLMMNLNLSVETIKIIKESKTIIPFAKKYALDGSKSFENSDEYNFENSRKKLKEIADTEGGQQLFESWKEMIPNGDSLFNDLENAVNNGTDQQLPPVIISQRWMQLQNIKIKLFESIQADKIKIKDIDN